MLRCRQNLPPEPFSRLGRMPRLFALLLALALAATLASCGEEDAQLLPGETAREITANLNSVEQLAGEGDCVGAEGAAEQVSEQIETLEDVDPRLKRALEEGAAKLNEAIAGCEEVATEAVSPATIPPESEDEEEKKPKDEDRDDGKGPKEKETPPDTPASSPPLPPQAEGKGPSGEPGPGGDEDGDDEESEEGPSGGVSPGAPAGEGD